VKTLAHLALVSAVILLSVPTSNCFAAEGKCPDHPQMLPGSKPTKEEQKRQKELRAQGTVSIAISEEGDVVEAKIVRASSKEAATELLKRAQSMKFEPRPGCGVFRTQINFTLE